MQPQFSQTSQACGTSGITVTVYTSLVLTLPYDPATRDLLKKNLFSEALCAIPNSGNVIVELPDLANENSYELNLIFR